MNAITENQLCRLLLLAPACQADEATWQRCLAVAEKLFSPAAANSASASLPRGEADGLPVSLPPAALDGGV